MHETEYGKFKIEKQFSTFRAHSPKVYAGIKVNENEFSGVCKGLKVTQHELAAIYYGRPFSMFGLTTVSTIGAVMRGAELIKENQHRNLTNVESSTSRRYLDDGRVLPIVL